MAKGPRTHPRLSIQITSSPGSCSSSSSSSSSGSGVSQNFFFGNFSLAASEVLYCLEPTNEDVSYRERLIDNFKTFTKGFKELKDCSFEPYGSYATGLYTRYGDVDLSVKHNKDKNILYRLQSLIFKTGDYSLIRYTTKGMPVLTFKQWDSHVTFDITCDTGSGKMSDIKDIDERLSGKMTASLLSHIKEIDGRFKQLVLLVKGWTMCHGINVPFEGGFKSYALNVMVIFHLQNIKPAILPPLDELCTTHVMKKLKGGDNGWESEFAKNVDRYKKSRGSDENVNDCDVYTIFYLFIKRYKHIRKDAYMSVKSGNWVIKTPAMKKDKFWIEEPFGGSENLARSIKDVKHIKGLFKDTYSIIRTGKMDDILKALVHKDLLKGIEAMRSNREVGPKVVASRPVSSSLSQGIMPRSSPEVLIPTKAKESDMDDATEKSRCSPYNDSHKDVLRQLGCAYNDESASDGDGDSHGDALRKLRCAYESASTEDSASDVATEKVMDAGKHQPPVKGCYNTKDDENDNERRSSCKDYKLDEKHIKREKNDYQHGSQEKLKGRDLVKRVNKKEINRDRRSHTEEGDRKLVRHSNYDSDERTSWKSRPRSRSPPKKHYQRKHSNYDSDERTSWKSRPRSRSPPKKHYQRKHSNYDSDERTSWKSRPRSRSPPKKHYQRKHSNYDSDERTSWKSRPRSRSPPKKNYQRKHSNYDSDERTSWKSRSRSRSPPKKHYQRKHSNYERTSWENRSRSRSRR